MNTQWPSFDDNDDDCPFDDDDPGDIYQDIPSTVPSTSSIFSSTSLPTFLSGVIVNPETDQRRQSLLVQTFTDGQSSDPATLYKDSPFTVGNLPSSTPVPPPLHQGCNIPGHVLSGRLDKGEQFSCYLFYIWHSLHPLYDIYTGLSFQVTSTHVMTLLP